MSERRYPLEASFLILLADLNIPPQDALARAGLPADLFARTSPMVTARQFFDFWSAVETLSEIEDFPLRVGSAITAEMFSPPIFACFCSRDLNSAATRLARHKAMIAPVQLNVTISEAGTRLETRQRDGEPPIPASMAAMELVFFVRLIRLATRHYVRPLKVQSADRNRNWRAYEDYFGQSMSYGTGNAVTFSASDAERSFLTANDALWDMFEPGLRTRLHQLDSEAGFRTRVRASLTESLATGACGIDDISRNLAVSPRTLQRRLGVEGSSFRKELSSLREELARHYLADTQYPPAEIAFLLGYDDTTSFYRAFHNWTGATPDAVRRGELA